MVYSHSWEYAIPVDENIPDYCELFAWFFGGGEGSEEEFLVFFESGEVFNVSA